MVPRVKLSMVDDVTWKAQVPGGPICYAEDPEKAEKAARLAYRARTLFMSLLGREPTVAELRELREPISEGPLKVQWWGDQATG